jgi:hypothetical protein
VDDIDVSMGVFALSVHLRVFHDLIGPGVHF